MKPLHYSLFCIVMHHVAYSGVRFAVALYAIQLQASPAVIGILIALFSVVPMLGSVPIGRLIDRRGSRGLMLVCALMIACGALMASLWQSIAVLFPVCMLVGGGFYNSYIAIQQMMGRYGGPQDRPRNFASLSTSIAISGVSAPLLAGFGVDHLGFAPTFVFFAVLPLISLAVLLSGRVTQMEARPEAVKAGAAPPRVLDMLGSRDLRRIYLMGILITTSWDTFLFLTPIYCSQLLIAPSRIGIILASYSVATLTIRMLAGPLSRRYRPWQLLILSIACCGASNIAFGFAASVPLLMLFAFMMGLSQGTAGPMINTILYEAAPPGRVSEAMGLRVTIAKAYQVGLPLLTGTLGTLIGVAPVFWLVATTMLGGAFLVRDKWRNNRTEQALAGK